MSEFYLTLLIWFKKCASLDWCGEKTNALVHRFFIRMQEDLKVEESFEIGQFQAS